MAAPQIPGAPMQDSLARSSGIQSVSRVSPGLYRAQFANGKAMNVTGAAGEQLFKQYGAGAPPAPVPAEPGAPPKERVGTTVPGPAPIAPQQAPGNAALPYAAEGVDPLTQKKIVGPARMENGQMVIDIPGSKGSPGGVTALGKEIQADRAAAAAAAAPLEQQAAAAREAGRDTAITEVQNRQAYLDEQRTQLLLQQQNEQDEAAAADAHAAQLQAKADKAAEDYANSRAPEQSTGESIMSAIGSAMGAFGAAIGHTPNFAGEFIQQLANNKIRKWEAETAIKGKQADNMLSRYREALGDMKLAKAAVKATLLQKAAIESEQSALSTASEKIGNTWREMSAAAGAASVKANAEKEEAFKLSFYKDKFLNKPAVSGSAPRTILATQGAYGERQDQNKAAEELRLKKEAADREKAKGPEDKTPDTVKKSIAEIDASLAGLDRMEETDKSLGKPTNLFAGGGTLASDEANTLAAQANAIAPGVARATEGDAATKDSMERAVGGLAANTPGQRQFARDEYRKQLEAKKQAILDSQ